MKIDKVFKAELMRGRKVFAVIGDSFFKASLSGPDLKLTLLPMTNEEVLSEIRKRMRGNQGM